MQNITVELPIRQTEQLNGYYAVEVLLPEIDRPEDLIGKTFVFADDSTELTLFLHPQKNRFQLLAPNLIDEQKIQAKLIQQSEVISEFQFPSKEQPCVILASAKYMGNALAIAKKHANKKVTTIVMLGGDRFPFQIKPARFWVPEMPEEAIGASTLLEDWGVVNRMASPDMLPGCFHGEVEELFAEWVQGKNQNPEQKQKWQTVILAEQACQKRCLDICADQTWLQPTHTAQT